METLQVFEYENLALGGSFREEHLEALARYNDAHGSRFFKLKYRGVQFQQYVGVIQVGNLTIEILPKIGKESAPGTDKSKWQKVLLDMLRECSWMTVHAHQKADLQYKYNSILEAYLDLFIKACEEIWHRGLIKKYRQEDGNVTALKGKLLFGENIKHNLVHQERFYTRHQVYDRNNIFNQILIKALNTIPMVFNNPFLNDRVYTLLNSFPEMDDIRVTPDTFSKLVFDRKSAGYEEAISIAAMILLNFRPDIQKGHNHVLAILFDMNDLWEEYVFRQLIKQYNAVRQVHRTIWRKDAVDQSVTKSVRPDIVLLSDDKTLIVDTKWKLPEYDIPGDADLKQMFVYNEYWEGANSVLMYPKETGSHTYSEGHFVLGGSVKENSENQRHRCGILKASVLQANSTEPHHYLNMDFGNSIIQQLREQKLI